MVLDTFPIYLGTLCKVSRGDAEHGLALRCWSMWSHGAFRLLEIYIYIYILGIQVPSQKVIGDYVCRLGGPKYLLRRYMDP